MLSRLQPAQLNNVALSNLDWKSDLAGHLRQVSKKVQTVQQQVDKFAPQAGQLWQTVNADSYDKHHKKLANGYQTAQNQLDKVGGWEGVSEHINKLDQPQPQPELLNLDMMSDISDALKEMADFGQQAYKVGKEVAGPAGAVWKAIDQDSYHQYAEPFAEQFTDIKNKGKEMGGWNAFRNGAEQLHPDYQGNQGYSQQGYPQYPQDLYQGPQQYGDYNYGYQPYDQGYNQYGYEQYYPQDYGYDQYYPQDYGYGPNYPQDYWYDQQQSQGYGYNQYGQNDYGYDQGYNNQYQNSAYSDYYPSEYVEYDDFTDYSNYADYADDDYSNYNTYDLFEDEEQYYDYDNEDYYYDDDEFYNTYDLYAGDDY